MNFVAFVNNIVITFLIVTYLMVKMKDQTLISQSNSTATLTASIYCEKISRTADHISTTFVHPAILGFDRWVSYKSYFTYFSHINPMER